jgi:hypothetical protein
LSITYLIIIFPLIVRSYLEICLWIIKTANFAPLGVSNDKIPTSSQAKTLGSSGELEASRDSYEKAHKFSPAKVTIFILH